ncbi:helix-turn-helix domain-containing protein, partial [Xanthovirga aplysinae]|uniref:helix-turn-helix domain-containing protein n=1 Tax=Xanthovirga aplysinae TaxID=2529853 RepID=UPI0012BBDF04
FFFSALGAFNGILLGFYFIINGRKQQLSNYFLGGLLLALSVRIGKSVFYYFNPQIAKIYLQIGLSACWFIGPFLFLYLKFALQESGKVKNQWKYHLIPLFLFIIGIGYLYPYQTYSSFWNQIFGRIIYFQWMIYIIASGFLLKSTFNDIFIKKNKIKSQEIWMLSIFFGNLVICLTYQMVPYVSYLSGALSFSFGFYLLLLLILFRKKKNSILFINPPKYGDKKINEEEASPLFQNLERLMIEEELYKNPNLKLPDVAKKLNILPHRLSQLINDNLGKSFNLYVNEYRITEAQKLIQENNNFTLEAIGYDCGFNSKSTFYSTFKKLTGTTPAKYKKDLAL